MVPRFESSFFSSDGWLQKTYRKTLITSYNLAPFLVKYFSSFVIIIIITLSTWAFTFMQRQVNAVGNDNGIVGEAIMDMCLEIGGGGPYLFFTRDHHAFA